MSFSIIIPSRYGSTRLAGKPLLDIAGKTMVQRVYEQACKSDATEVIVATDDQRIVDAVNGFGGQVVMTSVDHPSGTDRLQEVVSLKNYAGDHIVVNVQGDEPLIPPEAINQVAESLQAQAEAGIATLCERIADADEALNPNAVKVVRDANDMAQYFSRAPIPWLRSWPAVTDVDKRASDYFSQINTAIHSGINWYRHIGIYAYRVSVINQYIQWPVSAHEQAESLEQLRALDNGVRIHCAESGCNIPAGIDTIEDLEKVRQSLAQ